MNRTTLAVAVLLVLAALPAAAAHPFVAASEPGPGESLAPGDRVVVLRFGEAIDPGSVEVSVVDDRGRNLVTSTSVEADRRTVRITTDPLATGAYDVQWEATSTDGHPARGDLTVSVGGGGTEASDSWATIPGGTVALVTETAARVALLVGGLVAAGLAVVAGAIARGRVGGPWRRVVAAAAGTGLVGAVGVVAVLGYRQGGLARAVDSTGGSIGVGAASLMAAAAAAGAWSLRRPRRTEAAPVIAGALALGALAVDMVASHGQAGSTAGGVDGAVVMLVGLVHIVGAALWLGVLVAIALTVWRRGSDAAVTLARTLSPWAAGAVVVLGVSGVLYADAHLLRWRDLVTTAYGGLLLAKATIVVLPLALAAYHRFRVLPRREGTRFRRSVPLEALFLVGIVVLAGLLGAHPRPAHPVGDADLDRGVEYGATAGDYRLTLLDTAAADEPATLTVVSRSLPGLEMPAPNVSVDPPGTGPARTVALRRTSATRFRFAEPVLRSAGSYRLTVAVDGPHGATTTVIRVPVDGGDV